MESIWNPCENAVLFCPPPFLLGLQWTPVESGGPQSKMQMESSGVQWSPTGVRWSLVDLSQKCT